MLSRVNCSISAATRSTCGCSALAQTGDVQALPNRPPGNNHKITDWEEFRANALTHGEKTQVEMARLWQGDISESVARRAKRRSHNLTSVEENWVYAKKKTYGYLERDESKRQTNIRAVGDADG